MQMVKVRLEIKEIKLHKRKPNHILWGISSAGRASRLHREGHEFKPHILHHMSSKENIESVKTSK